MLVLRKLEIELPAHLHYHNLPHTLDVCQRTEEFALLEEVNATDLALLLVTAAYHDSRYLQQARNHEGSPALLPYKPYLPMVIVTMIYKPFAALLWPPDYPKRRTTF